MGTQYSQGSHPGRQGGQPELGANDAKGAHPACALTPAHHLRGAARNTYLSVKVGQCYTRGKPLAAPRLVHALVSLQRQIALAKARTVLVHITVLHSPLTLTWPLVHG